MRLTLKQHGLLAEIGETHGSRDTTTTKDLRHHSSRTLKSLSTRGLIEQDENAEWRQTPTGAWIDGEQRRKEDEQG